MQWMILPLKRYADFNGRSRRREYWIWVLAQIILFIVAFALLVGLGGSAVYFGAGRLDPGNSLMATGIGILAILAIYGLAVLAFFIPSLAVTVRRLHDSGRSGWWVMAYWGPYIVMNTSLVGEWDVVYLIALLAWIAACFGLLVLMCMDGTRGTNHYGSDPKGGDHRDVFA